MKINTYGNSKIRLICIYIQRKHLILNLNIKIKDRLNQWINGNHSTFTSKLVQTLAANSPLYITLLKKRRKQKSGQVQVKATMKNKLVR